MAEKKSERLEVRLGYSEKEAFVEACDTQGDTPSGAVRRFIAGYTRRADEDILSSFWRGAFSRRMKRPVIIGSAAFATAAVLSVFYWATSSSDVLSDDALFAHMDINKDDELVLAEHGLPPELDGSPNGVIRVLDLDNSGTISREEFVREGRMVYRFHDGEGVLAVTDQGPSSMTFVEFRFHQDRTKSGTYHNAKINADDLDRLVIWYPDGTNAIFEDNIRIESDAELRIWSETVTLPASVIFDTVDESVIVSRD